MKLLILGRVSIPYMGKVEQHFVDVFQYTTYILLCQSKEMYKSGK